MENILQISTKLKQFLQDNALSGNAFAQNIGIKKSSVYGYLKAKSMPGSDFWIALKETYPEVDLNVFLGSDSHLDIVSDTVATYEVAEQRPTLRVHVAHAGDAIDLDDLEGFFEIELTENYPTEEEFGRSYFFIHGDSMTPTLEHGDVVLGERVYHAEDYQDGAVYMVLSGGQLLCKRVYLDDADTTTLILTSDNAIHRDRRVERAPARLWRVRRRLTAKGLGGV